MKKLSNLLLILILLTALVACGTKTTYTKEISYLPSYSSDMKLDNFTPTDKKTGFSTASYIISNTTNKDVLQNYKDILKKDGWTITQDLTPNSLAAKKDTHSVSLIPKQNYADVQLLILAK